jgi:hypothetical protein
LTKQVIVYRKNIACLAKDVVAGKITFYNFLGQVNEEYADEDVDELVDLLTHAPKLGGLFGINKNEYDKYYSEIDKVIDKLLQTAA